MYVTRVKSLINQHKVNILLKHYPLYTQMEIKTSEFTLHKNIVKLG